MGNNGSRLDVKKKHYEQLLSAGKNFSFLCIQTKQFRFRTTLAEHLLVLNLLRHAIAEIESSVGTSLQEREMILKAPLKNIK